MQIAYRSTNKHFVKKGHLDDHCRIPFTDDLPCRLLRLDQNRRTSVECVGGEFVAGVYPFLSILGDTGQSVQGVLSHQFILQ